MYQVCYQKRENREEYIYMIIKCIVFYNVSSVLSEERE